MAGQGNYHKVLADHKRRLGDYEQVHFRRSTIHESSASSRPPASRFSLAVSALTTSGSGSGTGITLAPRRTSRALPQVGDFTANTASLHLRQTEGLWLYPNLSRQEATKTLFDRPEGTFIVRNSQKARYALSVRVPTDDPAVSHFLIQTNQQGFLTIQGSNLPFLSIYDLLSYFCFNKSGGMPCFLARPSEGRTESRDQQSSDSSDSEDDTKEEFRSQACGLMCPHPTSPPPLVPHHEVPSSSGSSLRQHQTHAIDLYPVHEEVFIDTHNQSNYIQGMKERLKRKSGSQSPPFPPTQPPPPLQRVKRQPPPKPPRGSTLFEDVFPPEEAHQIVRSVDSIVDMDARKLYHRITREQEDFQGEESVGEDRGKDKEPPPQQRRHGPLQRKMSWSSDDLRERRHVISLVALFERDGGPSPITTHFRQGESIPALPPRPTQPPRPPRSSGTSSKSSNPPVIPPHTPAPLIPPRPSGSKAPFIPSRERSSSDSTFSGKSRPPAPPPGESISPPLLPPKTWNIKSEPHYEFDMELREKLAAARRKAAEGDEGEADREGRSWATASADPRLEGRVNDITGSSGQITEAERELSVNEGSGKDRSKWKRAWPKKLPKFYRKPRKKIRKLIVDLSGDNSQEFGQMVVEFIADIKAHSTDPYQKMLSEIRTFITQMHDYLLQNHHTELINCGMEACNNFEHVVETSLQQCILRPLSLYIYLRIEEHLMENSSLFQVQRSVHQGKNRTPHEMGIRECLVVPGDKVVSEIGGVFNRMTKTYCAISKLEFLLEAVRLTYENVRDSKNPKKPMSDLGADDFLPLFVWVLVQCGFTRAEIEAEYMWGLAHPSLFNGEAGYYLTTLTSAINVLKETQPAVSAFPQSDNIEEQIQHLPCMNNLQTELKIYFEDATTGQYSSAYRLAVVPDMTVAEVCDIIAEKHCKSNPESYGLFTVVDGQATEMTKTERPQEVKKNWALERSTSKTSNPQRQPSSRFIAYRLRTPKQTK